MLCYADQTFSVGRVSVAVLNTSICHMENESRTVWNPGEPYRALLMWKTHDLGIMEADISILFFISFHFNPSLYAAVLFYIKAIADLLCEVGERLAIMCVRMFVPQHFSQTVGHLTFLWCGLEISSCPPAWLDALQIYWEPVGTWRHQLMTFNYWPLCALCVHIGVSVCVCVCVSVCLSLVIFVYGTCFPA